MPENWSTSNPVPAPRATFVTHYRAETKGDLSTTAATLAERVEYRWYGSPVFGDRFTFDTREQAVAHYQKVIDSGLRPGGTIENERWAFGHWGLMLESDITAFQAGSKLVHYEPSCAPDAIYAHSYRQVAIFPFDKSGLLAGEIHYINPAAIRIEKVERAEWRRVFGIPD